MRPLDATETKTVRKATATDTPVIPNLESPIVAKAENNPQEQALALTEDGEKEMKTYADLVEASSTKRIQLHLQFMVNNKTKRAKKI